MHLQSEINIRYGLIAQRLPCSSESKEPACNAGDPGSAPGLGRSPEEGNGNPLLAWRMPWTEGGAWQAIVRGVTELDTIDQLTLLLGPD